MIEYRDGSWWVEASPELIEDMSAEWSAPVQCKIEDGELIFRPVPQEPAPKDPRP